MLGMANQNDVEPIEGPDHGLAEVAADGVDPAVAQQFIELANEAEIEDVNDDDDSDDSDGFTIADHASAFAAAAARGDTYLRYSDRSLKALPPDAVLRNFHGLKSLLLHRNKLDDPDGLEHLTNLETLSLATNKLRKFPHQVLALEKLTYLNLSNNHLGFVPASIKNLKNLEVLWLNSTGLTCLPQEMSELGKLETLGARHNELKALPHEFSELKSLRWLTLADNKLSWLPQCFRHLSRLRHLNLSGNRFTTMPPAVGFMLKLRYCLFSRNFIRFPDYVVILRLSSIGSIKKLYLDHNPLIGNHSLRRFPFLHLHNTWLDWTEGGSTWQDSLETTSLDDSYSSMSSFEPRRPIFVQPEVAHKAVAFLL